MIRVTPYEHSGGRFRLSVRTLEENENPTAGESEENPLPLPLGAFVDGYVTQEIYYRVETGEGIEPLVVTLIPATADLDLDVWGADNENREPRASSSNPLTSPERVIIERWDNRNFTIAVSSFSRNPGAFRLRARPPERFRRNGSDGLESHSAESERNSPRPLRQKRGDLLLG